MDVPIRMIGIATTFFWVFLVIFGLTAIYSARDLGFNFGSSDVAVIPSGQLVFFQPIIVSNKGFYDIGLFNISTMVSDVNGSAIANAFSSIPVIATGSEVTIKHNTTIDLSGFLQNHTQFLFEDAQLNVDETVSMQIAEMIPVQAKGNFTVPWGAPLYNLRIGNPTFEMYNMTHARVMVPVSFENHAVFDIIGNLRIRLFTDDSDGSMFMGEDQSAVNAPQHSSYTGNIELFVTAASTVTLSPVMKGHREAYFETPMFNCGPVTLSYGG